jgi:hypothetical protein
MSPFTKISLSNPADAKAFFFALLSCLLFIAVLSAVFPRSVLKKKPPRTDYLAVPTPMAPSKLLESEQRTFGDENGQFRVVPEHFKKVDFKNHSYALYTPENIGLDLILSDGELQLPENTGWFALQDVYYKDVTGDNKAEAIVRLTRVKCENSSCDGGADLFYIYTMRGGKLTTLWQYQTGTRAYGCSSKSLTAGERQLVLELFGLCSEQAADYPGSRKFIVSHLTFILFEFDGQRFVKKTQQFATTESQSDVHDYQPAIRLY